MVATVVAAMAGTAVEVTGMAVAVGVTAVGVRASMLAVRIITAGMAAVMSVALFRPHGVPAGALSIAATEPEAVHSEKPGSRRAFLREYHSTQRFPLAVLHRAFPQYRFNFYQLLTINFERPKHSLAPTLGTIRSI